MPKLTDQQRAELQALEEIPDDEIDLSDIPERDIDWSTYAIMLTNATASLIILFNQVTRPASPGQDWKVTTCQWESNHISPAAVGREKHPYHSNGLALEEFKLFEGRMIQQYMLMRDAQP